jgi:hypothetical protein
MPWQGRDLISNVSVMRQPLDKSGRKRNALARQRSSGLDTAIVRLKRRISSPLLATGGAVQCEVSDSQASDYGTKRKLASAAPSSQHQPPGRGLQQSICHKANCKCKNADVTRTDRPGRLHARLAGVLYLSTQFINAYEKISRLCCSPRFSIYCFNQRHSSIKYKKDVLSRHPQNTCRTTF